MIIIIILNNVFVKPLAVLLNYRFVNNGTHSIFVTKKKQACTWTTLKAMLH